MHHLATKSIPKHVHYYVLKIVHFHLTALLGCIDLFMLDVVNIFQDEYCTSNKDLQNKKTTITGQDFFSQRMEY